MQPNGRKLAESTRLSTAVHEKDRRHTIHWVSPIDEMHSMAFEFEPDRLMVTVKINGEIVSEWDEFAILGFHQYFERVGNTVGIAVCARPVR